MPYRAVPQFRKTKKAKTCHLYDDSTPLEASTFHYVLYVSCGGDGVKTPPSITDFPTHVYSCFISRRGRQGEELAEFGPSKRPKTESKPTSKLASPPSAAAAIPMSVAQAVSGPRCPSVAATAKESPPPATVVRKGKRKRAAPAHLREEAGSSGATKKSTARSKKGNAAAEGRTAAKRKKTLTKGKGKGKVVPQNKTEGKGKGCRKKKPAAGEPPPRVVDSPARGEDEIIVASALLGFGVVDIAPAELTTKQAADAKASTDGGGGGSLIIDAGEQLLIAQRNMDVMVAAADMMERLPDGIRDVLHAFADEKTEAGAEPVDGAATGPGGGAGVGDGAGAGGGSGAGEAEAGMGATGEAVGG